MIIIFLSTSLSSLRDHLSPQTLPRYLSKENTEKPTVFFEGCTSTQRPFQCPDGLCAGSLNECRVKSVSCPTFDLTRCANGSCMSRCDKVLSSGCSFQFPIRCPSGRCVSSQMDCVNYICPADTPFKCKNNSCVKLMSQCQYPLNIRIIKELVMSSADQKNGDIIVDQNNNKLGSISLPLNSDVLLRGVAFNSIKNTKLDASIQHNSIYQLYFSVNSDQLDSNEFIRSAVFEIVNLKNPTAEISGGLVIKIKTDLVNPHKQNDNLFFGNTYCLGMLTQGKWKCSASTKQKQYHTFAEFTVYQTGIYAVIFAPDESIPSFEGYAYCGYLCKNKRFFVVFVLVGLPTLFLIFVTVFQLFQKKIELSNKVSELFFLKHKMVEAENLQLDVKGQTIFEKLEEGIIYVSNPLRNEQEDSLEECRQLNAKLRKIKEEAKRVNKLKSDLMIANKMKMEVIQQLRMTISKKH